MKVAHVAAAALAISLALGDSRTVIAQSDDSVLQLVVEAGRPIRVALDRRVRIEGVGQQISATVIEPVYAYDRIVVPAGTRAIGHIARLDAASKRTRLSAMLRGDFTPLRSASLQFDQLVFADGRTLHIQTNGTTGAEIVLKVADTAKRTVGARAREEIARRAKQAVDASTAPGKMERLTDAAIYSLPYHPQFLRKGTVYSARIVAPWEFGRATPIERAPPASLPDPESILNARLLTALDSATALRGTPIEAVLTQPVFSADRRLILPEGARLTGEVTFAKPARRFHRNGQLRFLFQRVQVRDGQSEKLLASLYSVESSAGGRVSIDEEGGASATNSTARFAAPALGALALAGSLHGRLDYDTDGAGPEMNYGGVGSTNVGGFIGFGALGAGLAHLSRPVTLTLTVVGLARTTYSAVFGKGRNISFPADTSIQIQLSPAARGRND